jgi:hypothetical protein
MSNVGKFTIVTVATPDYARAWAFCIASHRAYCAARGINYRLFSGLDQPLHPKWSKLQHTLDELRSAHGVMLLDADAEFSPNAPHFGELLMQHPAADILYANGLSERLNSGVVIFRGGGSSIASDFLLQCLEQRTTPVKPANFVTVEGENGHVIQVMQEARFNTKAAILSRDWNCTVPEGFDFAYIRHYTNKLRHALDHGKLSRRRPLASYQRLFSRGVSRIKKRFGWALGERWRSA